jgi:hypothetical protein
MQEIKTESKPCTMSHETVKPASRQSAVKNLLYHPGTTLLSQRLYRAAQQGWVGATPILNFNLNLSQFSNALTF